VIGAADGGSPVIDYTVSYALQSATSYTVFQQEIKETYATVTGLAAGSTYKFVV